VVFAADSLPERAVVAALLKSAFELGACPDGAPALVPIRSTPPYVIRSKLHMGSSSGVELLRQVKGHPESRVIPSILATNDRGGANGSERIVLVRTALDGDAVQVTFVDGRPGIPEAIRDRVFDPLFITKEIARGTGQGLANARTIVGQHKCQLWFDTKVRRGTSFHVRLPLRAGPSTLEKAA
jgi:CheY-like chemotaxis protein